MISAVDIARALGEHQPTAEQVRIIEAPLEPTLVVAGAGSGKTATMAARVVWLVVNGLVRPDEVLGLTFTRKAAGELSDRVRTTVGAARGVFGLPDGDHARISTYNSFAASLVRDHALRVGRDPDAALITRSGAWQIMNELVQTWPDEIEVGIKPVTVVSRALALADALRDNLLGVEEARRGIGELIDGFDRPRTGRPVKEVSDNPVARLRERLALLDLVQAHEDRKVALSVVEFSDQVATACEIARRVPAVGAAVRAHHRVVLLDEFQDTSVAQLDFLADLFGPGHAVTAVGDPNQAIYGWRGASAASLLGFRQRFGAPEIPVRTLTLTTSWRNSRAILGVANTVSRPLRAAAAPEGQLAGELRPRAGAGAGIVHASVTFTGSEEAAAIARWVGERWRPGSSAAVLVRARKQFPALVRAMRDQGIPASVVGLSGLLHTPEVIDLRSALEVAHDAARGDSMMRLLTNERLGIADLHVLSAWSRKLAGAEAAAGATASIVEAVEDLPPLGWVTPDGHTLSDAARERVTRLRRELRHIRASLSHPLLDVVALAERALALDIEVASRAGLDPTRARANLDAFAGHAADYAAGALNPNLGAFLAWLDAAEANENGLDIAPVDVSTDAVQILTVHAAKGLEWDVVAVAGLTEGQFPVCDRRSTNGDAGWLTRADELPHPLRGDAASLPQLDLELDTWQEMRAEVADFRARNFDHGIAEERRLAYVAMTRARSQLLLSACRFPANANHSAPLSRFLDEVAGQCVVPEGFGMVPEPDDAAANPTAQDALRATYPEDDPAGERRPRLDAAAAAVDAARAMMERVIGPGQRGVSALDAVVVAVDLSPRERELADDARALLLERDEESGPAAVELGAHLSASAAMALTRSPDDFAVQLRRPVPFKPQPRARVGTEFHAWLEDHFNQPALVFDSEADVWDPEVGAPELEELKLSFLRSPWAGRVPCAVEVDLETPVAGRIIRCRIDAVFDDGHGVEVVDWKTGRAPRGRGEFDDRQLQLALYRLAYARATGIPLENIRAAFVHVAEGVTLHADPLTEAQIEDRFTAAFAAFT